MCEVHSAKTLKLGYTLILGLDFETFVRLNAALGVNLKPNEDIDYAEDPFLPMSPMEALRTLNYHTDIPVLIGYNENDGLILTTPLVTDSSFYYLYRYESALSSDI